MNRARSFLIVLVSAFVPLHCHGQATISRGEPTVSSGGIYAVEGTLSKVESSTLTGGAYSVEGGTFGPVLTVDTPDAPTLKIQVQGPNVVIIWSAGIDAFKLEQTTGLGIPWVPLTATQQNSGGEVTVTIPIGSQNQFLRLKTASP